MTAPLSLRQRWLAAMRASTARAIGRECDYGMSEGDTDKFDPLGLLALTALGQDASAWFSAPGDDGAWVPRQVMAVLARDAGFPPDCLILLAALSDAGASWADMAEWVEAQRA